MRLLDALARQWRDVERERLLAMLLAGGVRVDGEPVRDPRRAVPPNATLQIESTTPILRGARKLNGVLDALRIDVTGLRVLDAGAASGGFCDVLLQRGASTVVCVDVAYGALDYRLRQDARTVVMERTNVMDLQPAQLVPLPEFAVCDLSFRSLRRAARHILSLTADRLVLALAKPQFEWIDAPAEFDGVVASGGLIADVLERLMRDLADEGVSVQAAVESAVRGRRGNREVFLLLTASAELRGSPARSSVVAAHRPESLLWRLRR